MMVAGRPLHLLCCINMERIHKRANKAQIKDRPGSQIDFLLWLVAYTFFKEKRTPHDGSVTFVHSLLTETQVLVQHLSMSADFAVPKLLCSRMGRSGVGAHVKENATTKERKRTFFVTLK